MGVFIDLTGKRFGQLIVVKKGETKRNHILWNCQCDCGLEKNVGGRHLRSGDIISCGSCSKRKNKGTSGFNTLLGTYKAGAKRRKLEFSLTQEEFRNLTSNSCSYCGSAPNTQVINKTNTEAGNQNSLYIYNGIDRIDNSKGYSRDNCVSCCYTCNTMKMTLSKDKFMNHIKTIYNHLGLENLYGSK